MNAHERGVHQAVRVMEGGALTTKSIMMRYGVSAATAKRDLGNLLWIIRGDTPVPCVRTVVKAKR
jgi:hypothetical protein